MFGQIIWGFIATVVVVAIMTRLLTIPALPSWIKGFSNALSHIYRGAFGQ